LQIDIRKKGMVMNMQPCLLSYLFLIFVTIVGARTT